MSDSFFRFPFSCCRPLSACLLFFGASGLLSQAQIKDQSNEFDFSNGYNAAAVAFNTTVAQTFTVGIGGTLDRIDIAVSKGSSTTANLTLSIWSTSANGRLQSQLTSLTYSASGIPTSFQPSIVSFNTFSSPVNVLPGTVLGIRLDSPAPNGPPYESRYGWVIQPQGSYSGGRAYGYGSIPQPDRSAEDCYFVTYVTPVPEPSTAALTVLAVSFLFLARRASRQLYSPW